MTRRSPNSNGREFPADRFTSWTKCSPIPRCGPASYFTSPVARRGPRAACSRLPAARLSQTPATVRRRAPLLGEHTDQVLSELGFSGDEIAHFRREAVV